MRSIEFEKLLGLTITGVEVGADKEEVRISTAEGRTFLMQHDQDCCEHVYLAETIGNLEDLVGSPLTMASAESEDHSNDPGEEDCTWTFYKLATERGPVTLRWVGTSNGYYSTGVSFYETTRFDT